MDYATLPTPPTCVADFCLNPIRTATTSIANKIAAVQCLIKASGLSYNIHSASTTESVTRLIGQAHTLVHRNGVVRIQTNMQIGTRTDKEEHFAEKVTKVESIFTKRGYNAGGGVKAEEDTVKLQRPV
ncbi:cell wall biogenesis protein-like protein Ecm15 [Cadophora sp. DSE1049]|nr:cell wall biogenesis protein-like protein Ecm15 [Cadophora sp. DSE1049]